MIIITLPAAALPPPPAAAGILLVTNLSTRSPSPSPRRLRLSPLHCDNSVLLPQTGCAAQQAQLLLAQQPTYMWACHIIKAWRLGATCLLSGGGRRRERAWLLGAPPPAAALPTVRTVIIISLLRTTGRACCQSGCTVLLQKLKQARKLTSSTKPRVHAPSWPPKNLRGMISVHNIFFSALMDICRVSTTARVKKILPDNLPNSNYPLGTTTKKT